ncbi:O-antigen ligase family protein [Teredinibacter sp. KSP-S5-2]|uniref:O-antigen ligase family protein n=1 Tax=Teredinibacter sp. KSP-S5-2 TaxID=3034506 RepID=UPI0029349F17|nr:O-antigen ligase family protein [Teredinibacter sp. KSP-S5-2]WNO09052.1 O-antigen ligase family protein [Teredinibacter sp. KSP-S5-2]
MAFVSLLFYLLFVLVRPQEFWPPLQGLPVVMVALLVAAISMMAQKDRRFDAPQIKILFGLVLVIFLSAVWNRWLGGGITNAQKFLTTAVLPMIIVSNGINSTTKQRIAMIFMVIAACIMVHQGMSQKASENGFGWAGVQLSQGTRITYLGIINDPNDLGMYLVMTLPIAMYLYKSTKNIFKYAFLGAAMMITWGVYLTNSRGALLGTMSLLAFWGVLKFGVKKSMIAAVPALPAALIVMSMFRAIDADEESAEGRLEAWYDGFQMLKGSPLFGVGYGQFTDHHYLTAHNSFVLVFSELGLLGYFLWFAFLFITVLLLLTIWHDKVGRHVKCDRSETNVMIAKCFTFSMLGYVVTAFFLSRSYTPILYLFAGLAIGTYYRATEAPKKEFGRLIKTEAHTLFGHYKMYIATSCMGSLVLIYLATRILL